MMRQTPLGHNRTTTRHNAGDALGSQRYVAQQNTGMNCEIVHALLGLLNQRVAENLPGQVLGDTADLFQRLVDRHSTYRHHGITDDPLTGFVNILARRQIHHGICTPARSPGQLLHLFFN